MWCDPVHANASSSRSFFLQPTFSLEEAKKSLGVDYGPP